MVFGNGSENCLSLCKREMNESNRNGESWMWEWSISVGVAFGEERAIERREFVDEK